ncbi:hypothetical protein, partial [Isoptericola sp. NPDC057191]|uniref:hypothetical protein n=1 Tax=Isoptericola sp. NPDC057191 TaxID=3346041 RepID=UPI00363A9388
MTDDRHLLIAREHDPTALRRALGAGAISRVRRGAYRTVADGGPPDARTLARDRIGAVHRQLEADHVFSHESAALLWGVPLWEAPTTTHVLQRSGASSRSARDVARHRGLPQRWVELEGLPVTDLARTVVDCVTTLHPLEGLVVADWALGHGLDRGEALGLLGARRRRNGTARGRLVLELAEGAVDPPWETWLRYVALRAGLPRPRTQFRVETHAGRFFVDLAWLEHRVLAEFDGRIKYRDGAFGTGYDAEQALFEEKVREDAITERLGVRPLRFVARDARDPDSVTRRLLARFPPDVRRAARVRPRLPLPPRSGPDQRGSLGS